MSDDSGKRRPVIGFTGTTPYRVTGLEKLTGADGSRLATKPVMVLCRCGQSGNKPFCDGSHTAAGIKGEKEEGRVKDRVIDYRGREITIHDNRGVCSHDGSCWRNLPAVFKKDQKFRWIDPDGAAVEETVETIKKCPSGALSYTVDGRKGPVFEREPQIKAAPNGPLEIKGSIALQDDRDSRPQEAEHYTLCRCGHSKNKPFCDGSHQKYGFNTDSK